MKIIDQKHPYFFFIILNIICFIACSEEIHLMSTGRRVRCPEKFQSGESLDPPKLKTRTPLAPRMLYPQETLKCDR